jgi:Four helix bundle sensory module for signal transduction
MQTTVRPYQNIVVRTLRDKTPYRLRLLLLAITIFAVAFGIVATTTVKQHDQAMQTIGIEAGPSVITAHQIKIGLLSMDAALADELLAPPEDRDSQEMADDFDKHRANTSKYLVAAARNITYGNSELFPIESVQVGLGQYLMQAQAARDFHRAGNADNALSAYRSTLRTLQESLLPNLEALDKANADILEETYNREKSVSALSRGFVLLVGLVLCGTMLYTQFFLAIRFRRRLNLPLLVATVCLLIFIQHLTQSLANCSNEVKVAKEDAYDSIVSLLQARSRSFDAKAGESRWLLDKARGSVYQKAFSDQINSVAKFERGHDFANVLAAVEKQMAAGDKFLLPGFSGALAEELNNVRFDGEAQAAVDTLHEFRAYVAADDKIRQLENAGNHQAALRLGLGYNLSGSNYLFNKYDDALGRTLKINEQQLDLAYKTGKHELDNIILGIILSCILIVVLAYVGLMPRLEEYSH